MDGTGADAKGNVEIWRLEWMGGIEMDWRRIDRKIER